MKFRICILTFFLLANYSASAQNPGFGCEYETPFGVRQTRVYQCPAPSPMFDPSVPSFHYDINSILPLQNKCFEWKSTGPVGSCLVFDGSDYHEGKLGTMSMVHCPIDRSIEGLIFGLSIFAIMRIRQRV